MKQRTPSFKGVGVARVLMLKKIQHPIFVLVCLGAACCLPLLSGGFPRYSDDGAFHLMWSRCFSSQLWAGELYPRWLRGMNGGLGSPTFFYYAPGPYFLTGLFSLPFVRDPLAVSAAAALVASGLSAYAWLRQTAGRSASLCAAALYVATPYHLAVDLYLRGAFAEFWAFAFMPLVMCFSERVIRRRAHAVEGLALSYALLALTHLPTALIFSPVPLCYALATRGRRDKARAAGRVLTGMILGAGLSGVYLLPALSTRRLVSFEKMGAGYLHYSHWFLNAFTSEPDLRLSFAWCAFSAAGVAALLYAATHASAGRAARRRGAFWVVAAAASLFLMLSSSRPVWSAVSVLQSIQFPWRFNAVLCVAVAWLFAAYLRARAARGPRASGKLSAAILLLTLSWIPLSALVVYRAANPTAEETSAVDERLRLSRDADEYFPSVVPQGDRALTSILAEEGSEGVRVVEGEGVVTINSWGPREVRLRVEATTDVVLRLRQFHFPLWNARLDEGEQRGLSVRPSARGLIEVGAPAGVHEVSLKLERSAPEKLGAALSAISAAATLTFAVWTRRASSRRRRKKLSRRAASQSVEVVPQAGALGE